MNYTITIILITIAVIIQMALIQKHSEEIISLTKRLTAQEDIISRVAAKQFEDSKSIATIREDAEKLETRVLRNRREIDKVRVFAYRQSTMKEVEDDAEAQGI